MKKILLFLSAVLIFLSFPVFGSDIKIVAVVEKSILSIGESFIYQIQINGSDNASDFPKDKWSDPDFSNSFNVEFRGGQNNSSRQISIINGRRKEIINTAYIISWSLTPLKTGSLTIPSVTVTIDGNKYSTSPVKIEAKEAVENENLKLLVTLDKDTAFVGEPLVITFTWYIGVTIKDFFYSVPFFQDSNFNFLDSSDISPDPSTLIQFPVDGVTVTGVQGKGTIKGKTFTTVTFSKLVIPKVPGNFNIPKSVISVSAEISNRGRGSDLFSSFFSSFSPDYSQFTVPSNDLSLKINALPSIGRPDNFNGYIGELNIETTASPLNVRVGDPITLTMKISGPKNIADWNPPDMNKQYELSANFKMPSRISAGKMEGTSVVFTQIIRSLNDSVTQIPSLEISYFDTVKGVYNIAKSEAIPIDVVKGSAVRLEGTASSNSSNLQQEIVQALNNGINYNYSELKILTNQSFGLKSISRFPLNLLLIIPPLLFLTVFIFTLSEKRKFFSFKKSKRNAISEITKELQKIESNLGSGSEDSCKKVEIVFQSYIAGKISGKISGTRGFISEKDIKIWLEKENFKVEEFHQLFEVFSLLNEIQYAGSFFEVKVRQQKIESLIHKILLVVKDLEGRIQ